MPVLHRFPRWNVFFSIFLVQLEMNYLVTEYSSHFINNQFTIYIMYNIYSLYRCKYVAAIDVFPNEFRRITLLYHERQSKLDAKGGKTCTNQEWFWSYF